MEAIGIVTMEVAIVILVIGAAYLIFEGIPGVMGNLGANEIAGYASNAGWQGSDLVMAVAVALAESSGNPSAVGDQTLAPPHGSIGLWQINTKAHPEFDWQQLTDPQYNANAAYQVYSAAGFSFRPWSTYGNGMASNHLSAASQGVTDFQNSQNPDQTETA